jgi:voltage-gated potassium channel
MKKDQIKATFAKTFIDEIFMALLAIVGVVLLALEVDGNISSSSQMVYDRIDFTIALIFLADWMVRFFMALDKKAYAKKEWWLLFAAIPISGGIAQSLRALRLIRLVRVIRLAIRLIEISRISKNLSKYAYLIQILIAFLSVTFIAALGFTTFELGTNQNVSGLWDGFWWAIVTASTIGYGDIYPVTTGGRVIAIFLMIFGIGTLGVLTANTAAVFIKGDAKVNSDPRE